jgi:hypothetical protein
VNRLREQLESLDRPLFPADEPHLERLCEEKAVAQRHLQECEKRLWKFIRLHNPRNVFIGGWWDEMEQFVSCSNALASTG